MPLTRVELEQFTAFANLKVDFSPGINAFVGTNGTGKTHLMKVCYAACDSSKSGIPFPEKLGRVFLPSRNSMARLRRQPTEHPAKWSVKVHRDNLTLRAAYTIRDDEPNRTETNGANFWQQRPVESVYIPVKEMLSNGPGFRSLYAAREIHFEEVYVDILNRAYLPPLRDPVNQPWRRLQNNLRKAIGGTVIIRNEEFFLRNQGVSLEFTLLAEGLRKLSLLWLLIRNGTLREGTILFWDEPETNLNPALLKLTMGVLLELQRAGVQIFLATHDYVVLRELDLQAESADEVVFHSLFHDENGEISWAAAKNYLAISPNAIEDTNTDLYDRQIQRNLGYLTQ